MLLEKISKFSLVFSVLISFLFLWGDTVFAKTIYQQLSDSSGSVEMTGQVLIGSFTVPNVSLIENLATSSLLFVLSNPSQSSSVTFFASPQLLIATTSPTSNSHAFILLTECNGLTLLPGEDVFCGGRIFGANFNTEWFPGVVYYLMVDQSQANGDINIRTNFSESFAYGYFSDSGGTSVPIAPGLSGFTDVGIATTSQQVYCNQNFSTSTGLLDSLGQSIALGFCNVSVFLFVPSPQSIDGFFSKLSSFENRAPVSWIYDVREIYTGYVATTTDNFPALTIDVGTSSLASVLGSSDLELLSKDTIDHFLPSGVLSALKVLISIVIWLGAIGFVYRQVSGIWHKTVT